MNEYQFKEKYEELQEEYAGVRVPMYEECADDLDWFLEEVE